jgi:anaerobic sulfite reductase subunit A
LSENKDHFLASAQDPEIHGTILADGFKQIAEYASTLKGNELEKARLELAVEYAGLFLGVWRVPAHPSESAYFTQGQLIMQEPRDEVLKLYRSMGVDRSSEFKEPEDHIALELQFMTHLCEKTNTFLQNGDFREAKKLLEVQRDFLNEHLGKWVPKLSADILKSARRDFYKAVAKITEGYIEMDKKLVVELIDSLTVSSGSDSGSAR